MIKKFSQNNQFHYGIERWIVEEVEELKRFRPPMGHSTFVIHTGDTYMIDSKGVWYCISDSTKDPIDCDCIEESTIWNEIPKTN